MEQFRQIGEVLGSLRALMVLQDDIQINRCQCSLLFDIYTLAFTTIAEEIKLNLKLEEKNTKWNDLQHPLKELQRVFKEGEAYVKQCLLIDKKDWWLKALHLHQNRDCVDYHIHNLLCLFPAVIEAIETAGEIAGLDQGEMQRRRIALAMKYDKEWNDLKLFQFRFGKQYLIPGDIQSRFESAWREDRWNLAEALREKKNSESSTKNQQRLAGFLIKKIVGFGSDSEAASYNGDKLFPSSILYRGDYLLRKRLGGQYKEIQWLGHNFVMRHLFGEMDPNSCSEISTLLSLCHPNILQYLCGFADEEKKEIMLVLEPMTKDLNSYVKENCGPRRKVLFSIPVVVDLMFQIARGMEYLHSRKIYHGELNPSNIFLKARNNHNTNTEGGYFHLKISGYGLSLANVKTRSSPNTSPRPVEPSTNPFIWYAPEVLLEQEQLGGHATGFKYTEKADVYSFGMVCFQLLTGKVPFEDVNFQGEKVGRYVRAGERPLFPYTAPRYLVSLARRCWLTDPSQRPSFSSICRILRYVKKFLVMNPDHDHPEMRFPGADYCEIEAWFQKMFAENNDGSSFSPLSVAQIPFQMFAYRLAEKDKTMLNNKDKYGELAIDLASNCRDDHNSSTEEDPIIAAAGGDTKSVASDTNLVWSDIKSVCSEIYPKIPGKRPPNNFDTPPKGLISHPFPIPEKNILQTKKSTDVRAKKRTGTSGYRQSRPPALQRIRSEGVIRGSCKPLVTSPLSRGQQRASPGHTSE